MDRARPVNASVARDMNESVVLSAIQRHAPVTSIEIAEHLKMDRSTLSRILRSLERQGFIVSTGSGAASNLGGRRPTIWELNPGGGFFVGIDIDVGALKVVLIDLSGSILTRRNVDFEKALDPGAILDTVIASVEELLREYPEEAGQVRGIGVSVPGRVDVASGTAIYAVNLKNWRNIPVKARLEERFNIPVKVEHDVRAMALGERWFGNATFHTDFLCVGLRAGIGLAVVTNDQIYRGSKQFAGDLGHIVVEPDGPSCPCGRRGCLEAVASEAAMLRRVIDRTAGGGVSLPAPLGRDPDTSDLYKALERRDPIIEEVVRTSGRHIGRTIAHLVNMLDPSVIVVGGSMLRQGDVLLESIRAAYRDHQTVYADDPPAIVPCAFGAWAFALGAAALWYHAFFSVVPASTNPYVREGSVPKDATQ